MRKAINENPMVQIGLLGALGLIVGVIFMTRMGGGAPAPTEETAATESSVAGAPVTPAEPAPAVTPAPDVAVAPVETGSTPFEAGKGLPAELVNAHESGDVVVLLVMQEKGIEDKPLERSVETLEARGDTTLFVTDVKNVAKYSRVAEGVRLDRVPALIVLRPLDGKLDKSEAAPLPEATVLYGFRGKDSVTTAVEDALYEGKQLSYDPG
jgi:hypothetical protein